jgi:hypothetical protein
MESAPHNFFLNTVPIAIGIIKNVLVRLGGLAPQKSGINSCKILKENSKLTTCITLSSVHLINDRATIFA